MNKVRNTSERHDCDHVVVYPTLVVFFLLNVFKVILTKIYSRSVTRVFLENESTPRLNTIA